MVEDEEHIRKKPFEFFKWVDWRQFFYLILYCLLSLFLLIYPDFFAFDNSYSIKQRIYYGLIKEKIKIFHNSNKISFNLPSESYTKCCWASSWSQTPIPAPERCFLVDVGDEKYIERWIENREISCELEKLFEWVTKENKLKK